MTIREAQELVEVWELKNGVQYPEHGEGSVAEDFWRVLSRAGRENVQLTDEFVELVERKNYQSER